MPTNRRLGPEGANTRRGPEGANRRLGSEGEDTEGHGSRRLDDLKATSPTDEPGTAPQTNRPRATDDDDVEGHNFGHNAMLSRNAASSREREVQRNLRQHELKSEARRPFFKKG